MADLIQLLQANAEWLALLTFATMLFVNLSGALKILLLIGTGALAVFWMTSDLNMALGILVTGGLLLLMDQLRLFSRS